MSKKESKPKQIPDRQPGKYSDGHPLDQVHYLESKIILKPDRFTSVESFRDFGKLVRHTAEGLNVGFITDPKIGRRPDIREIVFYDTPVCASTTTRSSCGGASTTWMASPWVGCAVGFCSFWAEALLILPLSRHIRLRRRMLTVGYRAIDPLAWRA